MVKRALLLGISLLMLASCTGKKKESGDESAPKTEEQLSANAFKAVPMPNKLSNGDPFPTKPGTIKKWIRSSSQKDNLETNKQIIEHGWGLWQAITAYTNQKDAGQKLRRFETWYTPADLKKALQRRLTNAAVQLKHIKRGRGTLKTPSQFHAGVSDLPEPGQAGVVGFVKYDPAAAQHIYEQGLFYESTLKGMVKKNKLAKIPDFPHGAVSLKPVFMPLTNPNEKGLYKVPVWTGEGGNPNRAYPPGDWPNHILVTENGKTNEAKNIYSVDEFIHFQLDKAQAKSIGGGAEAGDYAVLKGMHVTTREINRWTWQTFWWSKNQDNPHRPSSATIAKHRPSGKLDQAANHYAMGIAYSMVQPPQPRVGGSGENATSLYAYNPYLEAGFGKKVFKKGNEVVRKYFSKSHQKVGGKLNKFGMQSNCMSCHGQARYNPKSVGTHYYLTDQYFSMDAPYYKNTVKLDFLWSITNKNNLIKKKKKK